MIRLTVALTVALAAAGCGGSGTVHFTTYGEDFIEQEIPAADFEDGWSLQFSKFLITLGEVHLDKHDGTEGPRMTTPRVFDVHAPGPHDVVTFSDVPAERWDAVGFAIAPATNATAGNASSDDVAFMNSSGNSIFVEGSATLGAVTKTFSWAFTTNTLYSHCENEELGDGVAVPNGGEETVQLTIHGDHFVYDHLQADDAVLRFQALADADVSPADGEVTLEELAAVDLTSLPIDQYGTGSASGINTLRDFVTALSRTLGHFRGEGECTVTAR